MKTNEPAKVVLTIFTPAYNRADLLPRLFESVANQVEPGDPVEWLIIDDGSTDDTPAVLQQFQKARPDLVRFLTVENGGKHRAINRAALLAQGAWVMIVDSDDYLAEGAVERVQSAIATVEEDDEIGLIRGLSSFPGTTLAHRFVLTKRSSKHADWVRAQKTFDSVEVIRRSVLLLHTFPEYEGEKFMAESWLWYRMDTTHKTMLLNDLWVVCFYQANGLSASNNRLRASSPCGAMAVYEEILGASISLKLRLRSSVNWWRYKFHAVRAGVYCGEFIASRLFAPFGFMMYLRDVLKK